MGLPIYPWISFLVAVALVPWFVLISEASRISKIIAGSLFIIALSIRFAWHYPLLLGILLEVGLSVYVLLYIRLQR